MEPALRGCRRIGIICGDEPRRINQNCPPSMDPAAAVVPSVPERGHRPFLRWFSAAPAVARANCSAEYAMRAIAPRLDAPAADLHLAQLSRIVARDLNRRVRIPGRTRLVEDRHVRLASSNDRD